MGQKREACPFAVYDPPVASDSLDSESFAKLDSSNGDGGKPPLKRSVHSYDHHGPEEWRRQFGLPELGVEAGELAEDRQENGEVMSPAWSLDHGRDRPIGASRQLQEPKESMGQRQIDLAETKHGALVNENKLGDRLVEVVVAALRVVQGVPGLEMTDDGSVFKIASSVEVA